jgi:hypothetical protein
MGRVRRGGYLFVTWGGDHTPRHVHVFRDRELIVKWDLENDLPMEGQASRRIQELIEELRREGRL